MPEASLTVRVQLEAASKIAEQAARDVAALGRLKAAAAAVAMPSQLLRGAAAAAGAVGAVASLPRMMPPSLVPRPDMGRGVFGGSAGMPPGVQEAVRAQEQLNQARQRGLPAAQKSVELAKLQTQALKAAAAGQAVARPKNAWQIDQDRLAALAARQRGDTTQGPQKPGGGVGAGTVAALAAGGAAAGAAGGGKDVAALLKAGTDRMASEAAAAAAAREAGRGGATPGESRVTLKARTAAARKRIQDAAKEAKEFADSTETALASPDIVKSQAAAAKVARPEVQAQAVFQSQQQLGLALGARARRELLQGDRGKAGTTLAAKYQDEYDRSQAAEVQARREAAAESVVTGARRGKLLQGPEYRQMALQEAVAAGGAGLNQQREQTTGAQAQAAYLGTAAGSKELKETVALRKQEARAMSSIKWQQAIAEQGRFGASLNAVAEKSKGVGNALGTLFAFRIAEAAAFVTAASPTHASTVALSGQMLLASMGKPLLPYAEDLAATMQKWAKDIDGADAKTKAWSAKIFVWTTALAGAGYIGAKGLQAGAALWQGGRAAVGWFQGAGGAGSAAANWEGARGAATGGGVPGTFMGISSAGAKAAIGIAALGAAAIAAEYALLEWNSQLNKKAIQDENTMRDALSRKDVTESGPFKRIEAAPEAQKKAQADKELDDATRRYVQANKEFQEAQKNVAGNIVDQTLGNIGRWATGSAGKSDLEEKRARSNMARADVEKAQAAHQELIADKKGVKVPFVPGPGSPQGKAKEQMLWALQGLPQAKYTTGTEWDDVLALAAITSSSKGGLEAKLAQDQLDALTGILGKLDEQLNELKQVNLNPIARRRP